MEFVYKIKQGLKNIWDQDSLDFSYQPWRDWKILIIIFLIGEMVIFSSHYLFYQRSILAKDQSLAGYQTVSSIDEKAKLDRTYSVYKNKQDQFDSLKKNPPTLVDPGL
jgi:hypothetical protein